MAVGAIVGGISILAPVAQKYLDAANKEDPRRFQEAQTWYAAAIAGDRDAECTLRHMTGAYGCNTCGAYGQRCGFATDVAKQYCATVYNQLQAVKSGQLSPGTPLPQPPQPSSSTSGQVGNVAGQVADVASGVATALGNPTTQLGNTQQTRERLEIAGWIALAVVGGAIVFMLARRK